MHKNTELLDLQKISAVLDVSNGSLYPENTNVGGERKCIAEIVEKKWKTI